MVETHEKLGQVPVECLSKVIDNKQLKKMIGLLPRYEIKTISDLIDTSLEKLTNIPGLGAVKIQSIMQLIELLKDDCIVNAVIEHYEKYENFSILPCEGRIDESAGNVIKRFLKEYICLFRGLKENGMMSNTFIRHDLVELAYVYNYSKEMIAENKKIDVERVRQILTSDKNIHKSFVWQVRRMVKDGYMDSDASLIFLSDVLKGHLNDIELFCRNCPTLEALKNKMGLGNSDEDRAALAFIRHYVGAKLFGGEQGVGTRIKEQFIVHVDVSKLVKCWGKVFLLLDNTIVPFAKEALLIDMKKTKPKMSDELQNVIINIIENSNQFVKIRDGQVVKYQLHWKDLCSMQSRVERIVYEMGKTCTRQEIIQEYNNRAILYDVDAFNEKIGIRSKRSSGINRRINIQNIVEYTAGGVWAWKDTLESLKTFTMSDIIKKYFIQNEEGSLEDVYNYVSQYIENPNKKSVKTTLSSLCYSLKRGYYVYRHSSRARAKSITTRADITPYLVNLLQKHQACTYNELWDKLLINDTRVHKSKIVHCCTKHPEIFVINKGKSLREEHRISLNPNWSGELAIKVAPQGRPKKSYIILMKECAVNLLRSAENYTMPKRDVVSNIAKYLPENIKPNNVYKIFNDPIFVSNIIGRVAYLSLDKEVWKKKYQSDVESHTKQSIQELSNTSNVKKEEDANNTSVGALFQVDFATDRDMINLGERVEQQLYFELSQIARDNMNIGEFKFVWSQMLELMDVKREHRDSAYKRMLRNLYGYIFGKTDVDDRYYLFTEIRLCIEPFLKIIIEKINGQNDISGLAKVVAECQNMGILPYRDNSKALSRFLTGVIYSRNDKGHIAEFTPSDSDMIQKIKHALVICIYATYKYMSLIKIC